MEKVEALRASVMDHFDNSGQLVRHRLPWNPFVTPEEVECNAISVTSTSPGTDHITVRLLKACWEHIRDPLMGLYNQCLVLCHVSYLWRLAEVAMLPKIGKDIQVLGPLLVPNCPPLLHLQRPGMHHRLPNSLDCTCAQGHQPTAWWCPPQMLHNRPGGIVHP